MGCCTGREILKQCSITRHLLIRTEPWDGLRGIWKTTRNMVLVFVLKEAGEFIGDCGITIQNIDGEMLPEIGYHIHKKYWRRGFAKEAAQATRDWVFQNTQYDTIYS